MLTAKRAWIVVGLVIVIGLFYALGPSYSDRAERRVAAILDDMQKGTGPEQQAAIGLWAYDNALATDSAASDAYDRFRREKGLARPFAGYRIVRVITIDGEVPTARVQFEIEGSLYSVDVPERRPVRWSS